MSYVVSLQEACSAIVANAGEVTYVLVGEPGIGKTSTMNTLAEMLPTHNPVLLNAPELDIGDVFMRIPDKDTGSLTQFLSDKFPRNGKPFIVNVDELGKARGMMRIALRRLILEGEVGDWKLPEGSIVFATMNDSMDGLGDILEGHEGNRVSVVKVGKSSAKEWLVWATDNKVNPIIRAFVNAEKQCMRSYYEDGQENNPYIFNPNNGVISFVSPRSLYKAGKIVDKRHHMSSNFLSAALAGTVGAAAGEMINTLIRMNSEIKSTKEVIADPVNTPLPQSVSASLLMIFNAVDDIETQDDLSSFMKYMERIGSSELEATFFFTIVQSKRTVKIARGNAKIKKWTVDNVELFA